MKEQNLAPRRNEKFVLMEVVVEAQLVVATRYASHLDSVIAHICKSDMNRTEIIELLGQESEKIHNSILNQR